MSFYCRCDEYIHVMATRNSTYVYGLGPAITEDDSVIKGVRLPTCRQVLRCTLYQLENSSMTKYQAANIVYTQVAEFYHKANIPMITEIKSCQKITALVEENKKLRAIPVNRRENLSSKAKLEAMEKKMNETFQLWPLNVDSLIKNDEDRAFLQSMKTDRLATFGGKDSKLQKMIERKNERLKAESRRREKVKQDLSLSETLSTFNDSNEDSSDEDSLAPGTSTDTKRSHHRKKRTGTSVFIPHDILQRPKLVSLATRMKLTPAQQSAFTEAFIEETGGDNTKVSTSYASADRSRRSVVKKIADTSKEDWKIPELATLHWDSKLIPSLTNKYVSSERVAVLVGTNERLKLLGVPSYQPGTDRKTGEIIAQLTEQLLTSWSCKDSIVNMTFDTTAANTGHITAACISVQQVCQKPLLWSGCRHHVGEVILSHVFDDLQVEVSKSPDVTLFARFRKNYELLSHSDGTNLSHYDPSEFSTNVRNLLNDWRQETLQLAKSKLSLQRDDYKEFIELCIMHLEGPSSDKGTFSFKRPGALHKARWMAKLLYSIKICLLEKQIRELPSGTITALHQVSKIRDFVLFVTTVYSHWWMTCSGAVDAPFHDLMLYKKLLQYAAVSPVISTAATNAMNRHLWYLTAEMVPLALFSTKVNQEDKQKIASKLQDFQCLSEYKLHYRYGNGFGKPKFPTKITQQTNLSDLLNNDSWFLFHSLKLPCEFLKEDVATWNTLDSYKLCLEHVRSINVVNDGAERGVKLTSDFLSSAKTEEHYQNVLQVVEEDRRMKPNLRKRACVDE